MSTRPSLSDRGLLSTGFVAVTEEETLAVAVDRFCSSEHHDALYCYVTDAEGRLEGILPLRQLLAGPRAAPAGQLAIRNVVALRHDADPAVVQDFFLTYRLLSFPVIDGEGRLIGVVPADKLADSYAALLDRDFDARLRSTLLARLSLSDPGDGPLARVRAGWTLAHVALSILVGAVALAVWQRVPEARGATLFLAPAALLAGGLAHRAAILADAREDAASRRRELLAGMILGLPVALLALLAGLSVLPGPATLLAAAVSGLAAPVGTAIGSATPAALATSGRDSSHAALVAVMGAVSLVAALHGALAFLVFSR